MISSITAPPEDALHLDFRSAAARTCCVVTVCKRGEQRSLEVHCSITETPTLRYIQKFNSSSETLFPASDRTGCHVLGLQGGRGGGGKGAVHDGTEGLVGSKSFGQQVLLLWQRIHLEMNSLCYCCVKAMEVHQNYLLSFLLCFMHFIQTGLAAVCIK